MNNASIIYISFLLVISSCKVYSGPTELLGKWEKVEYGVVLEDGTEDLSNVANKECPNDFYSFTKEGNHTIATFEYINDKCKSYPEHRTYILDDNKVIVNGTEYIYTIEELTNDYLKLYLHKHEFNNTDLKTDNTVFVYTFTKSN